MAYLTIITIGTLLILTTPNLLIHAKTTPIAPGPTPAPLNLTAVLEKGGQYTTFLRLLKETQVGKQVQSQLNNSYDGLTIFAPTDNAFSNLKAGTLNSLNAQEQVSLILYHVLPRFYSMVTFETASNPVRTQASGSNGVYGVNITSSTNQVNVSTGIVDTPVQTVLYSDFPLAVYSVDKVLLPYDLFGPKLRHLRLSLLIILQRSQQRRVLLLMPLRRRPWHLHPLPVQVKGQPVGVLSLLEWDFLCCFAWEVICEEDVAWLYVNGA
ncbi:putative FAS1 domain-containing protein [Dioscorea sansibarensis]